MEAIKIRRKKFSTVSSERIGINKTKSKEIRILARQKSQEYQKTRLLFRSSEKSFNLVGKPLLKTASFEEYENPAIPKGQTIPTIPAGIKMLKGELL